MNTGWPQINQTNSIDLTGKRLNCGDFPALPEEPVPIFSGRGVEGSPIIGVSNGVRLNGRHEINRKK